ncbi:hydrolase [Sulfurimonas sp. SAG-AH-194-C20]|nr:hydrolase [Sulfurimonas sp. SAG-AH-194-C20]MDF1878930.1 hydrolase [Sulfurimonas sp. SAG-AH-194-C20]
MKEFSPSFFLQNRHLQTVYSTLFRKVRPLKFTIEKFILNDGDFLQSYWHYTKNSNESTPIVMLFHGLTGSFESPYIQGIMQELSKNGFNSVLMHFRGCATQENDLPRSYHSGETGDALEFIQSLHKKFPESKLFGVGYSLGANMLLKLLGEVGEKSLLTKVVAVSPPMQLDICASSMNKGLSRYYQYRLLKDLKSTLYKKYDRHDMQKLLNFKRSNIQKLDSFWKYDDAFTAPIHGFSSASEYYEKCSAKQFLKDIKTPTLIIHSYDDPFMTPEVIPTEAELSDFIDLEITKKGGHVGFVEGTFFKPEYWLEKRIIEFLL